MEVVESVWNLWDGKESVLGGEESVWGGEGSKGKNHVGSGGIWEESCGKWEHMGRVVGKGNESKGKSKEEERM